MKNVIAILCVFSIFAFTKAQAQSCPIPEPLDKAEAVGTYSGTYLKDGKMTPIKMKISKKGETLQTEIALGSSKYQTAETFLCPRENLHITITESGKELEFRGRPENGKLVGNFFYKDSLNNRVRELYSMTKQ